MRKNKFDGAINFIDANIEKSIEKIRKGIIEEIGFDSNQFNHCFKILTNEELYDYIVSRKLYFVSQELLENKDKKICDIAQDFGYSEQSVLNRMMKTYCGCTPNDIRNNGFRIPNDKYTLDYLQGRTNDSRLQKIINKLENDEIISNFNIDYLEELYSLADNFGFSVDTAYQISELAERLEIPVDKLMEECFNLKVECESQRESGFDILPEYIGVAACLGIKSQDKLEKICEHYQCAYYDLDENMVKEYYKK